MAQEFGEGKAGTGYGLRPGLASIFISDDGGTRPL